ncbi:MAG: patatin-like phospholipase family protein [Hahellaceae bacterium]|nr:patatin-like phospholipase family protein [Hahellaceae bacterium]MCP5169735.1 patatin-like phospholipase family protein [Hahellaceae bacterium]
MAKYGVVLTGGGARAAYQVGVLKAIGDVLPDNWNPFRIICGTSAGAINAVALAGSGDHFKESTARTEEIWRDVHVDKVFRADLWGIVRCLFHWARALMQGGFDHDHPVSLLDNRPLGDLLLREISFERLTRAITQGYIDAVSITACGYNSGDSVSFFQGAPSMLGWRRANRVGVPVKLNHNHVLASSAIPTIFAPVKIHREFFGDGAIRQLAPLSSALHLGADRVLIVGVTNKAELMPERERSEHPPTIAQIVGHLFNAIFLDSLDADIEHMHRVNNLLNDYVGLSTLKPIKTLEIAPSEPIDQLASRHVADLPRHVKRLFGSVGAGKQGGSSMASYLLFEGGFCGDLIDLGYKDGMAKREEILSFFADFCPPKGPCAD